MAFWQAVTTVVVPLAGMFFPAFAFVRFDNFRNVLAYGSQLILWNIGGLVIVTFFAAFLGIPLQYVAVGAAIGMVIALTMRRRQVFTLRSSWVALAIVIPILLAYAIFAVPYFLKHDGLPTGDSQKAIFWAQQILATNALPDYTTSLAQLNRDAGDFFTPGLHTLTALIMSLSPAPLISIGLVAILGAIGIAWVAASLAGELFDDTPHIMPPLLVALLILANVRFLRYLREPGYHFQNIFGELMVFGLLFVGLRLLRRFHWPDAILGGVLTVCLVLVHQFSVFVGFFFLLPLAIIFVLTRPSKGVSISIGAALLVLLLAAIPFGLYQKIPHLFTAQTHLAGQTPPLIAYPLTMGTMWFLLGIGGFLLMAIKTLRFHNTRRWAFIVGTAFLFALSQGPRIYLDIPPVRALFYLVVPLSICAAYFIMDLQHFIVRRYAGRQRLVYLSALLLAIIVPTADSVVRAYASSTHTIAPNSTLTPEIQFLTEVIASYKPSGAVLADDYNRRATSWFLLSHRPTLARLAADIQRQMDEAGQSDVRMELYLKQLDYEKIFSLGSNPIVAHLFDKHDIALVAGIVRSSLYTFQSNPSLQQVAHAGDVALFKHKGPAVEEDAITHWLLRPSTLANDIGDFEDTYEHLPASVRAARLGNPERAGDSTFRATAAPIIPLQFNVGDFVQVLWDKEAAGHPDIHGQFLLTTVFGPPSLQLQTPTGTMYDVVPGVPLVIQPHDIQFTDKGFVRLTILNPDEQLVGLDLIALGLAQVP